MTFTLAPVPASFFEIVAVEMYAWRNEEGLNLVVTEIYADGTRRELGQEWCSRSRAKKWDEAAWKQRISKRRPALLCSGARRELLWGEAECLSRSSLDAHFRVPVAASAPSTSLAAEPVTLTFALEVA